MNAYEKHTLAKIPAKYISYSHTICAFSAFLVALVVGCYTHYDKIVQNEYFGYPQEWFPSVSATTGDRYPARALFQLLIALTAGPRFALVYLWYIYTTVSQRICSKRLGKILLSVGIIRTIVCGGWVFITSTDDHSIHDVAMVMYLLCTLPWQVGVLYTSASNTATLRKRKICSTLFFGTLPFMIYYFLQHKVHHVPGAYSVYALFEWSLIFYDVSFDAITSFDFERFELKITHRDKIDLEEKDIA